MNKIAPYNTHYEAYAEMLGKPNVHSVFEHILDIYSKNIRAGQSGPVVLSFNEIARKRHISKSTVPEIIKLLEATKIISCDKDDKEYNGSTLCTIDVDRFVSLIYTFIELNIHDKKKLTTALYDGDEETLKSLGYALVKNAGKKLSEQKGNFDFLGGTVLDEVSQYSTICPDIVPSPSSEQYQVSQNSTICPNIVPSVLKQYHLSQNSTTCPDIVPPFKDNSTIDGTILGHLYPEMSQYSTTSIKKLVENLGKERIKSMFEEMFSSSNEVNLDKNTFLKELDEILDCPEQISPEKMILWWYYFGLQVVLYWDMGGTILGHSNNRINNKKENNKENEVLFEKNQNTLSGDSLPAHPENNFKGLEKNYQDKDDNDDMVDLAFARLVNSGREDKQSYFSDPPSYEDLKKKGRLPYFPVDEIENIIADPATCLDRSDKIFINRAWDCLLPFFAFDKEDENGEISDFQQDPEGMSFPRCRII
jgi:DNA-binding Lrp family transcriptional regulator